MSTKEKLEQLKQKRAKALLGGGFRAFLQLKYKLLQLKYKKLQLKYKLFVNFA